MESDIETPSLHDLVERVDRRIEERDSDVIFCREREKKALESEKIKIAVLQLIPAGLILDTFATIFCACCIFCGMVLVVSLGVFFVLN